MEKITLLDAIGQMRDTITSTLGLTVKKRHLTVGSSVGVVIRTNIQKASTLSARLEIIAGMGHNSRKNNVLSLNFAFYNNNFLEAKISRETYENDIIGSITAYIDTDDTISFFLASREEIYSARTVFELVALGATSEATPPENRIVSITSSPTPYQPHDIEQTVNIG